MNITASTKILYSTLTPRTIEAVNDLNSIIEKIIGTKLVVVSGWQAAIPENSIFIGYNETVAAQFPKIDWRFNKPEKVIIAHENNRVVISGRDVLGVSSTMPDRVGKPIQNVQMEYGTANAIWFFVNKYLGVRFFYPSEDGAYYPPKTDAIKLPNKRTIHHPVIQDRSMFHLLRMISNKGAAEEYIWAKRNLCYYSSSQKDAPHAFVKYWEKYKDTNPEIFALIIYKGVIYGRRPWQTSTGAIVVEDIKMCLAEPKLLDICLLEFEEQLKADPNKTHFSVAVADGWNANHCQCDKCEAWGNYSDKTKPINLSDREIRFANALARKLKKKYPGKPYFISTLGYGYSRLPPTVKADSNVQVVHVTNCIQRGETADGDERANMMKYFAEWDKMAVNLSSRPNLGNPMGCSYGMIDFDLEQLNGDMKFFAEHKCNGLWFDSLWSHWVSQMPYYYVLAQLAYEPKQNFDTLMKDFYAKCYGAAALEMKIFYGRITYIRRIVMDEVKTRSRFSKIPEYFTQPVRDELEWLINTALEKTQGTQYQKRVEFAAKGLAILLYLVGENIDIAPLKASWPRWYLNWNRLETATIVKEIEVERE